MACPSEHQQNECYGQGQALERSISSHDFCLCIQADGFPRLLMWRIKKKNREKGEKVV